MRTAARAIGLLALSAALFGCPKSTTRSEETADAAATAPSASTLRFPETDAAPVTAGPVSPEEVAKFVNPKGLPAYSGPTGSVEGTIRVTGDPPASTPADFSKCPAAAEVWGKQFREAPAPDGSRVLADAIVAVTGYTGSFVPEKDEAETVKIEGCGYQRRVVTMTFGQRLEVKNDSTEFWTPLLEPTPNKVMMMAPPKGDAVRLYPKRPGRFLLVDHDRRYANADVFVMLHPLHATTDLAGHYRIDGVPVGKLKVNTTHPRITTEASADVTIEPNVVARVDLVLRNTAVDASAPPQGAPSGRPVVH